MRTMPPPHAAGVERHMRSRLDANDLRNPRLGGGKRDVPRQHVRLGLSPDAQSGVNVKVRDPAERARSFHLRGPGAPWSESTKMLADWP